MTIGQQRIKLLKEFINKMIKFKKINKIEQIEIIEFDLKNQ